MQLTNRQVGWVLGFSLTVVAIPASGLALTVQEVPNPRQANGGWVTDMADILSPTTEAQLNQIVSELEAKKGAEFAIVTVPQTTPSSTPKEFATELFNTWKIGKQGQDNGLLLLISKGDRRIEIETGYSLEGVLPDAKVGQIIDRDIKPKFKQGDFDGGTLAGTQALVAAVGQEIPNSIKQPTSLPLTPEPLESSKTSDSWVKFILGGGAAAISIILAALYFRRQEGSKHLSQRDRQPHSINLSETHQPTTRNRSQRRSSVSYLHNHPLKASPDRANYSGNSSSSSSYDWNASSSYSDNNISYSDHSSSSYDSSSSSSYSDSSSSYSSSDFGGGSSGGGGAGSDF